MAVDRVPASPPETGTGTGGLGASGSGTAGTGVRRTSGTRMMTSRAAAGNRGPHAQDACGCREGAIGLAVAATLILVLAFDPWSFDLSTWTVIGFGVGLAFVGTLVGKTIGMLRGRVTSPRQRVELPSRVTLGSPN
jgi:hypothetical protein